MLIVHVANSIFFGGVGAVVRNLVIEQERLGLKTALVLREEEKTAWCTFGRQNGLATEMYFVEKYRYRFRTVWGLVSRKTYRKIRAAHPDDEIVFHYHNPLAFGLLAYSGSAGKLCTIHGLLGQVSDKKVSNWIFKQTLYRMLRKEVKIIGCAQAVAEHYNQLFGFHIAEGIVNGVADVKKIPNDCVANNGKIHIGFASVIDELKGWKILAEAFVSLPLEDRDKCELYLAGRVVDCDALEAFTRENRDVTYLGEVDDVQQRLLPYLDILVLPSRTEGMPMIILEALQAGCCIVCTPVGGIPEIVEDGVSGWFIERNAGSLCEKLSFLIRNPEIRVQTRRTAYEQYRKVGSSTVMAEKYLEQYSRLGTDKMEMRE